MHLERGRRQFVSELLFAAAAMSKSMLVERLREAEDRLMTMRQEETMNALVQAKIKLAQADYVNLELQVSLSFNSVLATQVLGLCFLAPVSCLFTICCAHHAMHIQYCQQLTRIPCT